MEEQMKKKRPVKFIVLGLFLVLAAAVGISVVVTLTADARRSDNINEQLFLGVRYLSENNYEAAIVYFDQVLEIDSRNVPTYIGNTLAYEYLGDREKLTERYNLVEADNSNLYLYLSERNPLGLRLSFQGGKLRSVLYTCEVPDNLRSKAIGWIGNIAN